MKDDFLAGRLYVFTPKGDVINLPKGATALDFAYEIHTKVGDSCCGAKVNGRLVSFATPLENADMVEIIVDKSCPGPKRDWLEMVATSEAKRKIRNALRKKANKVSG